MSPFDVAVRWSVPFTRAVRPNFVTANRRFAQPARRLFLNSSKAF